MDGSRIAGLVLAAGAGTRFGGAKALARDAAGVPWIVRVVDALTVGGCGRVTVVLGAEAAAASSLVPAGARIVVAEDWARGLSHSLRAGLASVRGAGAADANPAPGVDAVVVVPVDVPALVPAAVTRVISAAGPHPRDALVRAMYDGVPGHPVLIGAAHLAAVAAEAIGDSGAGPYLAAHGALAAECADLWSGSDIDGPR